MAIRTVVTRGYGNGTFNGTIALVVVRGYVSGVDEGGFSVIRNNPMIVSVGKLMNR